MKNLDTTNLMKNDGFNFELRNEILGHSLLLESIISLLLSWLLNIKNRGDSVSFGNKSTALSFSQKVNLLIDIGAVKKDQRDKFSKFMEIRNQFVHNIQARSLETCCKNNSGLDNYLLKNFPGYDNNLEKEKQLKFAFDKLVEDVFGIVDHINDVLKRKIKKDSRHIVSAISNKAYGQSVKYVKIYIEEYLISITDPKGNIKSADLTNFANKVHRQLFLEWDKQYNEIIKTEGNLFEY